MRFLNKYLFECIPIFTSLGFKARNMTVGSQGNSIFCFLRNHQTLTMSVLISMCSIVSTFLQSLNNIQEITFTLLCQNVCSDSQTVKDLNSRLNFPFFPLIFLGTYWTLSSTVFLFFCITSVFLSYLILSAFTTSSSSRWGCLILSSWSPWDCALSLPGANYF